VGNGKKASFWYANWLNGQSPRNIAPLLSKDQDEKNSVSRARRDNYWIAQVCPLTTGDEIREYVTLWEAIHTQEYNINTEDQIHWKWTAKGEYSTQSAYLSYSVRTKKFNIGPIWKAKTEPKCRFFAWLLLHRKILTADNLEKRGWPNDPLCKSCNATPESLTHLCKECTPILIEVWDRLLSWFRLSDLPPSTAASSILGWWKKSRVKVEKKQRSKFDGLMIYFWWNIWKKRNRRTFNQEIKTVDEVAYMIREEVQQFKIATQQQHQQQQNVAATPASCLV
jgi:hypothetical protein